MNRYKPLGWRYESYRHSLAAKGIRTRYKVPPAWRNVKYYEDKPYVATGVDKKGRIQYIYPKSFSSASSEKKFNRIERFEKQAPAIIDSVMKDVKKGDNPEAEIVYTMYKTGFRPGSENDTMAEKKAFGASTLLKDHVSVRKDDVKFKFIAKKGVPVEKEVKDKLLADIIKRRMQSRRLFDTSEGRLRAYFDRKTQGRFQLKDLRTLKAYEVAKEAGGDKKEIAERVSEELSNTPAVAISSYIHPRLINE